MILSGVVLAGGASRRMGRDKARLVVDGEPLVVRAHALLTGFCEDVVVASGDGRRLDDLGLPQVADTLPDCGPLGGIVAGLRQAAHPVVAVLAVDMPHASPAVFRLLASLWDGQPALAPVLDGGLEPLHAIYAREAGGPLEALLQRGVRSLRQALTTLGATPVPPEVWRVADPAGLFAHNLNIPTDLPVTPAP